MSTYRLTRPQTIMAKMLWDKGKDTVEIASILNDRRELPHLTMDQNKRPQCIMEADVANSLAAWREAKRAIEERQSRDDEIASREELA